MNERHTLIARTSSSSPCGPGQRGGPRAGGVGGWKLPPPSDPHWHHPLAPIASLKGRGSVRYRWLILAVVLLAAISHARAASDLSAFTYDQRLGNQVPLGALLQDQQGQAVTLGQALDRRPTILALGYFHCPNLCGLVRDDLMNALSRLGGSVLYSLVVLSIDPTETTGDAQSALLADAGRFDRPDQIENWHYLTGTAPQIKDITEAVGFRSRFDAADKQFLHPAGIVFLTGAGTVSSYLLGLGYQPHDVGLGITRAADGVTARALPILLLCFHYDPATGRYSLAILRVLQLGAAITVLVVAGTMTLALRRERGLR
jgi:protein SCO1